MSGTRSYKKPICYHPQCIYGGKPADFDNIKCRFEPGNDRKVFCSPECGADYIARIDEVEEENRIFSKLKTKKSRHREELAKMMFFCLGKKIDIDTLKKMIERLDLSSPWV